VLCGNRGGAFKAESAIARRRSSMRIGSGSGGIHREYNRNNLEEFLENCQDEYQRMSSGGEERIVRQTVEKEYKPGEKGGGEKSRRLRATFLEWVKRGGWRTGPGRGSSVCINEGRKRTPLACRGNREAKMGYTF